MKLFNTNLIGLQGHPHPAITDLNSTWEVRKARPHMKIIAGNYLTYQVKSEQSGGSATCRICDSGCPETIEHFITACKSLEPERQRIIPEFHALCKATKNKVNFEFIQNDENTLCQFIVDPTSMNLPQRVNLSDPLVSKFFTLSRDICYSLDKRRMNILRNLDKHSSE